MSEEQAQQLMYQVQMLENYISELSQRENTLYNVMREATSAIASIKSLKEKPDSETLVPLGMGTYIQTKSSLNDKIILNVGSGVAMEKTSDSAINYLEARIKEIEVALKDASTKKQEASTRLEQMKNQFNQMVQSTSSQQSG